MRQKAIEAVASASFLKVELKQMLCDTFIIRQKAANDALLQPVGYYRLSSQGSGRVEKETEKR